MSGEISRASRGEPPLVHDAPDAGQGGPLLPTYRQRRIVPRLGGRPHAQFEDLSPTRSQAIPRGAQREMFFDMAKRWTDLAINIESSEALADPASPPANDPGEPYRFGSRIGKAPIR